MNDHALIADKEKLDLAITQLLAEFERTHPALWVAGIQTRDEETLGGYHFFLSADVDLRVNRMLRPTEGRDG